MIKSGQGHTQRCNRELQSHGRCLSSLEGLNSNFARCPRYLSWYLIRGINHLASFMVFILPYDLPKIP